MDPAQVVSTAQVVNTAADSIARRTGFDSMRFLSVVLPESLAAADLAT
jgi:hypothetical protein